MRIQLGGRGDRRYDRRGSGKHPYFAGHNIFLIPGYGAQGGKAEDIAKYLVRGNGGVVNSSRAVLLAYQKAGAPDTDFAKEARNEVLRMREEIQNACEALRISRCCGK